MRSPGEAGLMALCARDGLPTTKWVLWIPDLRKKNGELSVPEIWKRRTPDGVGTLTAYVFPDGRVRIADDRLKTIAEAGA